MEGEDPIKQLAALAQIQSETIEALLAEQHVLLLAVAALVRSHPQPEAFAQAFRQAWLRADDPLGRQPEGGAAAGHIAQALEVLEESCTVALNIRPPDIAGKPGN